MRLLTMKTLSVLAAGLLLLGSGESAAAGFRETTPAEASATLESRRGTPGFVLLDVRTPAEFAEERIDGSVNLDFQSRSFRDDLGKLDREATYLLYCRSGNRSGKALVVMKELGFRDVIHLSAGIVQWKEKGLPTVRGR